MSSRPRRAAAAAVEAGINAYLADLEARGKTIRPLANKQKTEKKNIGDEEVQRALRPSMDAYWAREDTRTRFGVLEIDTTRAVCDADHLFVRSVFWGLDSLMEARVLACIGNNVYASYDDSYPASGALVASAAAAAKAPRRAVRAMAPYVYNDTKRCIQFVARGRHWETAAGAFAIAHRQSVADELAAVFLDVYHPDLKHCGT
jgi:hypothetical protein